MRQVKYEKAWDNKLKQYVLPSDINPRDIHDKCRFFSEKFENNESIGKILTVVKETTVKNKFKRVTHFRSYTENTYTNREQIKTKEKHQESQIHKIAKNLFRSNNKDKPRYIKVPRVETRGLMSNIQIIGETYLPILKVVSIEKMDSQTNKIPDIVILTEIDGIKQELQIEIYYKHYVNEAKRRQLIYFKKNCIEIDVSFLKEDFSLSENDIKKRLVKIIENGEHTYWISCKNEEYMKALLDRYACELAVDTVVLSRNMHPTLHYDFLRELDKDEYYKRRLMIFKDILNLDVNNPKYPSEDDRQYCEIGDCLSCKNCLGIQNYFDTNINNVRVLCNLSEVIFEDKNSLHILNFLKSRLREELLKEDIIDIKTEERTEEDIEEEIDEH